MGIKDKFKEFIASMDEDEVLELGPEEVEAMSKYEAAKSRVVSKASFDTKMVLFEPRSFDEAQEIGRRLKDNKAAVINLHKLQRDYAQRTIDFLTGVVFALDGTIQKIGQNVILCAPKSIGVNGKINVDGEDEQ